MRRVFILLFLAVSTGAFAQGELFKFSLAEYNGKNSSNVGELVEKHKFNVFLVTSWPAMIDTGFFGHIRNVCGVWKSKYDTEVTGVVAIRSAFKHFIPALATLYTRIGNDVKVLIDTTYDNKAKPQKFLPALKTVDKELQKIGEIQGCYVIVADNQGKIAFWKKLILANQVNAQELDKTIQSLAGGGETGTTATTSTATSSGTMSNGPIADFAGQKTDLMQLVGKADYTVLICGNNTSTDDTYAQRVAIFLQQIKADQAFFKERKIQAGVILCSDMIYEEGIQEAKTRFRRRVTDSSMLAFPFLFTRYGVDFENYFPVFFRTYMKEHAFSNPYNKELYAAGVNPMKRFGNMVDLFVVSSKGEILLHQAAVFGPLAMGLDYPALKQFLAIQKTK